MFRRCRIYRVHHSFWYAVGKGVVIDVVIIKGIVVVVGIFEGIIVDVVVVYGGIYEYVIINVVVCSIVKGVASSMS